MYKTILINAGMNWKTIGGFLLPRLSFLTCQPACGAFHLYPCRAWLHRFYQCRLPGAPSLAAPFTLSLMRPSFLLMFLTSSWRLISPSNWPHRSCSTSRVLNRPRVVASGTSPPSYELQNFRKTASTDINTGLTARLTIDTKRQVTNVEIKSAKGNSRDLC